MKLKQLLWNKPFCNDLHFFLFAIILLLLSINYQFFYLFLGIYLIFIYKKTKYLLYIVGILISFLIILKLNDVNFKSLKEGTYNDKFLVEDISSKNIILKYGNNKIIIYETNTELKPGDVIEAKLEIENFETKSYSADFNALLYYKSKRISNHGTINYYKIIEQNYTVKTLKYDILNFYENKLSENTFLYVKSLIFGVSDFNDNLKEAYANLYISHILAISGMHIMFLCKLLSFLCQKVLKIEGDILITLLIGIYVIFIGLPSSSLRAFLFLFLNNLNKIGSIKYTKLDVFSLSFIIMIFINPYSYFQNGFILSFLISFVIIFMNEFLNQQAKLYNYICYTFICIFSSLPIIINQTKQLAIFGLFFTIVIGFILGKYLLPLILLILIFPINIYEYIFIALNDMLLFLSENSYKLNFPYLNIYLICIYYFLFILLLLALVRKIKVLKYTLILLTYLSIIFFILPTQIYPKITFIDVGQGDSSVIILPNKQGVICVDTFNNVDYLKSLGINKIDYLILSHFDFDHTGSIDDLKENIKIENVVYSIYEDSTKINLPSAKILKVKSGDYLNFKGAEIFFLGPINCYSDSNSNSLVFKLIIENKSILYTGDMTIEEENDLILKYKSKLNSDVLKVGHHGSNTSTSSKLLNYVSPIISIVSVGRKNKYGLPDTEVIKRLERVSKVYKTSECGNIDIYIKSKLVLNYYKNDT